MAPRKRNHAKKNNSSSNKVSKSRNKRRSSPPSRNSSKRHKELSSSSSDECDFNNNKPPFEEGIGDSGNSLPHNEDSSHVIRLPPPNKPPHDPKAYRVIKLPNGLQIVLISELESEEGGTVTSNELTRGVRLPSYDSEPCLFQPRGHRQFSQQTRQSNSSRGDCSWCKSFSHNTSPQLGATMSLNEFVKSAASSSQGSHLNTPGGLDPRFISCSVAACVRVGYLDDPQEFSGLAHLVEHLVFMGSQAYPIEDKFISFVRENDGTVNACTLAELTKYQFDVGTNALDEALSIFSNFFVEPLFSLDSIKREIENIDHEFRMKKQNDAFSRMELLHSVAKKNHPYRTFACGSKESLAKDCKEESYKKLQSCLVDFHRKHYTPQNMSIAVQGALQLDELEKLMVKNFSKLSRKTSQAQAPVSSNLKNPFDTSDFKQSRIFVEPVGAIDSLYVTWALPTSAWTNYETKPLTYLSSVISSEVLGGLVDYLKTQKWILDLKCGIHFDSCTKYGVLFAIRMYITDEGYQCQNEIIQAIFVYIQKLNKLKPSKVVYEDISSIKRSYLNNYGCNCSSEEMVDKLSTALHFYPPDKLISGDKLLFQFNSAAIEDVMSHLTADSANIMIFSHGGPGEEKKFTKVEPRLKIHYDSQRIDSRTIRSWAEGNVQLRNKFRNPLQKNRYKTTNFTLRHRGLQLPELRMIRKNEHTRAVWLPLAIHFPFSCLRIALSSNQGPLTGNQIAMLQIWADMLRFELREPLGLAREAGVYSIITAQDSFLAIEVYGYDIKALQLAREILHEISKKNVLEDETFFSVCKNFALKMCHYALLHPIALSMQLLRRIKSFGVDTAIEAHSWLLQTSNKEFNYFIQNFMSKMKLSLWVAGNALKEDVELFVQEFEEKFDCNLLKRCYNEIYSPRTVALPLNNLIYRVESLNRNHSTSMIVNYYQFCPAAVQCIGLILPLISMMEVPFFNEIRTQKTLGYAVSCGPCLDQGILGAVFYIVSDVEKHKMEDVSAEIDKFLENFNNTVISTMTQNEYSKLTSRFPSLKEYNLASLKKMYPELFLPSGTLHCKASVQVVGHKKKSNMEKIVPKASHARDYLSPIELKTLLPKDPSDDSENSPATPNVIWVPDIDKLHRLLPLYPLPHAQD